MRADNLMGVFPGSSLSIFIASSEEEMRWKGRESRRVPDSDRSRRIVLKWNKQHSPPKTGSHPARRLEG